MKEVSDLWTHEGAIVLAARPFGSVEQAESPPAKERNERYRCQCLRWPSHFSDRRDP